MADRSLAWLAWSLCALSLLLLALSLVMILLERSAAEEFPWQAQAINAVGTIGAPVLGGLLASRRPRNPIGWLWLGVGLGIALSSFAGSYATYALGPGSLPAPRAVGTLVAGVGWTVSFILIPLLLLLFPTGWLPSRRWRFDRVPQPAQDAVFYFGVAAFAAIPVAAGIAILRHRLYDIDVLVNRTLVYGLLTLSLTAVYVGGILVLQGLFRALTGQGSQLAVVASTLTIAALFNPLRRRIQAFIDRRFYRGKYDARQTLEAFSARLRDETDLETLSRDLVGVVRETVQPARASLWLRGMGGQERFGEMRENTRKGVS